MRTESGLSLQVVHETVHDGFRYFQGFLEVVLQSVWPNISHDSGSDGLFALVPESL